MTAMSLLVGAWLVPIAFGTAGRGYDNVSIVLSADRDAYYVGEPVRLTAVVRNDGEEKVDGFFSLRPYLESTEITYRRIGTPVQRFRTRLRHSELTRRVSAPFPLKAGETLKSDMILAFDIDASRHVLSEPGRYEFQVGCRCGVVGQRVVSNVVRAAVSDAPSTEHEAFLEYSRERFALLAQFDPATSDLSPSLTARATTFLQEHGSGPYGHAVKAGLTSALEARVIRNRATKEERALYETLRLEGRPH